MGHWLPESPGRLHFRLALNPLGASGTAQKRTPEGAAQPGTGVPILGSQSTWEVAEIVVG